MSTLMWFVISGVAIASAVACVTLAVLRHWIAFWLFFVVYVIGIVAAAVQAVLTT